jgi:hypothetical protein
MIKQKSCFSFRTQSFEQKSCFAPIMTEQKSCFASKCLNKSLDLHKNVRTNIL